MLKVVLVGDALCFVGVSVIVVGGVAAAVMAVMVVVGVDVVSDAVVGSVVADRAVCVVTW